MRKLKRHLECWWLFILRTMPWKWHRAWCKTFHKKYWEWYEFNCGRFKGYRCSKCYMDFWAEHGYEKATDSKTITYYKG